MGTTGRRAANSESVGVKGLQYQNRHLVVRNLKSPEDQLTGGIMQLEEFFPPIPTLNLR